MPMIRFMVLAMLVAVTSISNLNAQEEIRLTGLSVFDPTDTNTVWKTGPASQYRLFVVPGPSLNLSNTLTPNATTGLDYSLSHGTYTFHLAGNQSANLETLFGFNVFLDAQSTPAMSGSYDASTNLFGPLSGQLSPNYTSNSLQPSAGLLWTSGRWTVELTAFNYARTTNNDIVRQQLVGAGDGVNDYVGSFTLNVVDSQAIPEPSSALLLLLASSGCVAYRRHKNNKKLSPELANA